MILAGALPAHRVESGIELLAGLGERRTDGALAGTGKVEAVVAAFSRTRVKAHTAQCLGELRILLAANGTNHHNPCTGSYLRNAIIAHGGRPVIRTREGLGARRIGIILANDCFKAGLPLHYRRHSRLSAPKRRGSMRAGAGKIPIAGPAPRMTDGND